jgi:SAM-dependent methyltransferase
MGKLRRLIAAIRSPRRVLRGLNYVVNDDAYWDDYVRNWQKDKRNESLQYLGNEWKNEEQFLTLLQKYSIPGGTALEIGSGGGRITSAAAKLFNHVYACDVSAQMLRVCKASLHDRNVSYHRLDGFTLQEFGDCFVDRVFSHDVFVHFSSLQVYPYLEEIKRVLKPGGIGLISFYNFLAHFKLFKDMSLQFRNERRFPPHMRVHFITEEMVRAMLADQGLEVIDIDKTNFLVAVFHKKNA